MKQKIVFFGSGWFVVPVVEKLIPHGLDLVVTTEKDPKSPLLKFCEENNLQTLKVSKSLDLIDHQSLIINHDIAVLASYGAFIPDEIISIFSEGIINIHPSLLPKYKGPSPIQYQLLNGETRVGVTLIKLDDQIDHGPILSQKQYNLQGNETSEDLLSILFEIGARMVDELILKLENGEKLTETPQDHSQETWSFKITKQDGLIDLDSPSLQIENLKLKIDRMIRAFYPWPGVWFHYPSVIPNEGMGSNSPVIALRQPAEKQSHTPSRHPALDAGSSYSKLSGKIIKLLPEGKIQVEGKNPMNYKDFINGFGEEGKSLLESLQLI